MRSMADCSTIPGTTDGVVSRYGPDTGVVVSRIAITPQEASNNSLPPRRTRLLRGAPLSGTLGIYMNDTRSVLLTSAASGVGRAVQQASTLSARDYRFVCISSTSEITNRGENTLPCPPTAERAAFQARTLQLAETMGVCLVVPGRDEDAAALAAVPIDLQVRGAMLASGPSQPVLAAYDKAATAPALG